VTAEPIEQARTAAQDAGPYSDDLKRSRLPYLQCSQRENSRS
jgi:hypothetical protein